MNKNFYAILMAGGVGSRFWPVSTRSFPKQFHDMLGTGQTLMQTTFDRLAKFVPSENIFILTNAQYQEIIFEQLPELTKRQVVLEPAMRNTAPCILLAALKIKKENPKAVMMVAPSDHWIEQHEAFVMDAEAAMNFCAEQNALMTLGIKPTFPNTGYGYIEYDKTDQDAEFKKVLQFREKPDFDTAKSFLEQGNFLWNGGIFVWSCESVIHAFKMHQRELYDLFIDGENVYNTDFEDDFLRENYAKSENISVDYAIMEKSDNVFVLPASFDWNDLGTWGSLFDKLEKGEDQNAIVNARVLSKNSQGNMIRTTSDKIVVVEGLNDYIIVDKDEVLLIFPKTKEQDIKQVLEAVKERFGEKYG